METFREFEIKPRDQGEYLAKLAFATKREPKQVGELRGDADFYRSYCYALAEEYQQSGQLDKAAETLALIPRDGEVYRLIVPYAKVGQLDQAMEIVSSHRDKGNPYYLERTLASYLAGAGKRDEARKLTALYLADLRVLKTPGKRLEEADFAANLLGQIGDDMERRSFLADCERWKEEEIAAGIASKGPAAFTLARLGISANDKEFAKKCIRRAVIFVKDSPAPDEIRLANCASLEASLGLVDESKQTARESLAVAREIPEQKKREDQLSVVTECFAGYRNESLIGEIDTTIGEISDFTSRALAIRGVLELEIKYEQWDRAKRHLAEGREFLRRKDVDRAEVFVHQFELDLLAARLGAKQTEKDASRKLLQELLRRGYSPLAGDFTKKVFDEQMELGFLEDAWWTATWIPELDERYSALGAVMESAVEAKRAKER